MQQQSIVMVQGGNNNGSSNDMALLAYDKVKCLANTSAVVVFTMTNCCMSHVVKRLFFGLGVGPTIIELDQYEHGAEIKSVLLHLAAGGGKTAVPMVFVGGKLLGGIETVMACHINGTLIPLLKDAGALWL